MRDAARLGELDGVAGEVEQHLTQPRSVADHLERQPVIDIGGDFEFLRLRARREQFGDVLDQRGQREGALLQIDLAGFDLGIVQQLLDQRQQGVARGLHGLGIGGLLRRQRRVSSRPLMPMMPFKRRADLVARHREEARLGAVGGVGLVACLDSARSASVRSVTSRPTHCSSAGRPASVRTSPSRQAIHRGPSGLRSSGRGRACLWLPRAVALFEHVEGEAAADQPIAVRSAIWQ